MTHYVIGIVMRLIEEAIGKKFTGSIQVNFYNGNITNINKNESIKIPEAS